MNNPTRRHSPASERNGGPILAQLQRLLPERCTVLEVASGTGQHAAHFTAEMPGWTWQPTDGDAAALPGIAARCADRAQVLAPLHLDVLSPAWPVAPTAFDALYCANMLHISPWATCAALMQGAARHLRPGGVLALYGPYLVDGEPTAQGNLAFDADLRGRDPRWGLRRLEDVVQAAARERLAIVKRVAMPANNLVLVFERESEAH